MVRAEEKAIKPLSHLTAPEWNQGVFAPRNLPPNTEKKRGLGKSFTSVDEVTLIRSHGQNVETNLIIAHF